LRNLTGEVQRLINNTEKRRGNAKIVKRIQAFEDRFKRASRQLEQVNTGALIDQIYSQEKVNGFTCEQIDYLCRILPNLLLAFGLIGTFSGITINLSTLSQTINQTNISDVSSLIAELKQPLTGMTIAFTTSLTGIFFSALLTVVNFIFNVGLAKYQLISSLEDYLDNICLPKVQGNNRLDKIVNKMVSQQDEFLTKFGDTVREAVEKSIGNIAKQIADGNKETTDLARQVYERFTEASGVISIAANEFKNSMSELNTTSQVFKQASDTFNESQFPQKLSLAAADLSNTQQQFSQSAISLAAATELMQIVFIEVQNCNQSLINLGNDIRYINQISIDVLDLHQSNQNRLGEIIPKLGQEDSSYQIVVNKLDELIIAVNQSLQTVRQYTAEVNFTLTSASNQIDSNNQITQVFVSNMESYIQKFSLEFSNIQSDLTRLLQDNNSQLISEYQTISNTLIQGINRQTSINTEGFKRIIKDLHECNLNIARLQQGVQ